MLSLFNFSNDYATDRKEDLVKAGAFKALLRTSISSLPINYQEVFRSLGQSITQIWTYSYQHLENEVHESINDYIKGCGEYGSIFFFRPKTYIIYYNDIWPEDVKNWMFLSLYACAELNLVPVKGIVKYSDDLDDLVNNFVYYFLAPDPVLKECGINSAKEISTACCMPLKNALAKSRQLKNKRGHNRATLFDISLIHNFSEFISGIVDNSKQK